MRKILVLTPIFLFLIWSGVYSVRAQDNVIVVLEIAAPVTPVMTSYFERGLETAVSESAAAMLIILDTPGGDVITMINIVQLFRNADIPVIVFVGPDGAQAASAGSVITAAAHAAAMAPGTIIGAASPINSDGSDIGETAYRKTVEDMKATMRSLTDRRGEEAVALAEAMIEDARAVTAQEALDAGFIDVIAGDVDDALTALDGLMVTVDGQPDTLETANADLRPVPLNFVEQLLFILANPLLIGILLTIGAQALIFEITNPGGWAAGVIGILLIALALFGAGQLPVNYLGFGLIVVAFALLIAEAFTHTSGPLAATGTVILLAGLLVLFNSPGTPEFARISIAGALGITAVTASFFVFMISKVLQIRRTQPLTGVEGMVGQLAVARVDFQTDEKQDRHTGTVLIMGEIWRAESEEPVVKGDEVVVKGMDGFTFKVRKG